MENILKTILTTPVSQLTFLELTTLKVGLNKMKMPSEKISDVNKQIQEELESAEVTPELLEQETNEVFDVEFKLETIISNIATVIAQYEAGSNAEPQPRDDMNTEPNRQSSGLKLPKINLSCFNDKYSDWTQFFDHFKGTVDGNSSLSPIQKLQYLKASLKDEPAKLLAHIPTTSANYEVAVQL